MIGIWYIEKVASGHFFAFCRTIRRRSRTQRKRRLHSERDDSSRQAAGFAPAHGSGLRCPAIFRASLTAQRGTGYNKYRERRLQRTVLPATDARGKNRIQEEREKWNSIGLPNMWTTPC